MHYGAQTTADRHNPRHLHRTNRRHPRRQHHVQPRSADYQLHTHRHSTRRTFGPSQSVECHSHLRLQHPRCHRRAPARAAHPISHQPRHPSPQIPPRHPRRRTRPRRPPRHRQITQPKYWFNKPYTPFAILLIQKSAINSLFPNYRM